VIANEEFINAPEVAQPTSTADNGVFMPRFLMNKGKKKDRKERAR
jgi:hypothetical protein